MNPKLKRTFHFFNLGIIVTSVILCFLPYVIFHQNLPIGDFDGVFSSQLFVSCLLVTISIIIPNTLAIMIDIFQNRQKQVNVISLCHLSLLMLLFFSNLIIAAVVIQRSDIILFNCIYYTRQIIIYNVCFLYIFFSDSEKKHVNTKNLAIGTMLLCLSLVLNNYYEANNVITNNSNDMIYLKFFYYTCWIILFVFFGNYFYRRYKSHLSIWGNSLQQPKSPQRISCDFYILIISVKFILVTIVNTVCTTETLYHITWRFTLWLSLDTFFVLVISLAHFKTERNKMKAMEVSRVLV